MKIRRILCAAGIGLVFAANVSAQKPVKFTSAYSSLGRGCRTLHGRGGTDDAFLCKGVGGYKVRVYYSAAATQINAERGDEDSPLATLDLAFDQSKTTLEWRLANGKPFAVIMRVPVYGDPAEGEYFGKIIGYHLKIIGLAGREIDETIDAAMPRANQKAREAADKAYKPQRLRPKRGSLALQLRDLDPQVLYLGIDRRGGWFGAA